MQFFQDLLDRWPSTHVARHEVGRFSGGILHPRTMANLDSKGVGPRGRVRFGRVVAYPVRELIEWMEGRTQRADTAQRASGEAA